MGAFLGYGNVVEIMGGLVCVSDVHEKSRTY